MTKTQRVSLDEVVRYFDELEDPRSSINQKHPLVSVVVIAMMAVLAGAGGPTAIARWAELKKGFLEAVYQEAMELELGLRGIPFVPQLPITIYYKGHALSKFYVADLFCNEKVLVEIKVMERLTKKEEAVRR